MQIKTVTVTVLRSNQDTLKVNKKKTRKTFVVNIKVHILNLKDILKIRRKKLNLTNKFSNFKKF